MPIATLWHVTLRAVQDWWQDNCLRLAALLAYYTTLSLAPLVLLIVGVVGLVLDRQQVGATPQPHAIPGAAPQTKSEAANDRAPERELCLHGTPRGGTR